jgi:hypothetical protein
VPLAGSIEAFGSALLFCVASRQGTLTFGAPPDAVWLRNVPEALRMAARWWGYSESCLPQIRPDSGVDSPPPVGGRALALCFSGGVDSFYTLLRGEHRVEVLVMVHGYDIRCMDTIRARAAERSLRQVAAALGIRAVLIRTNLREHPACRGANWEQVHGGALAAVGHLLSEEVDRLAISASYPRVFDRPWGSHRALDPCWSSSRVTILHVGAEKWRAEKLAALLDEPLVRAHLRVCWENRAPTGNCGACEKCLRTMLALEAQGCLSEFPVFPPSQKLAVGLAQVRRLKPDLVPVYAAFLDQGLGGEVRQAVAALVKRSAAPARAQPRPGWWRRLIDA